MVSITIFPVLFRIAKLAVSGVSIEYDEHIDRLTLRGNLCSTDERFGEFEEPKLTADFMDASGNLLYKGDFVLLGSFTDFGFCQFVVYVTDVSEVLQINSLAEIRLSPC